MGERRKRRSLWDKEGETKHFSGTSEDTYWTGREHHSSHESGQYHDFSASESYRAPNFRDKSGQPSLESIEENPVAPLNDNFNRSRDNASERKEIGGENKYYQKMSPELKYSQSLGNDRSHSHRYPGRGRSRSRSRSRGRSRSRSLSRGRERERARGRNRSRSRSRSRSRGDGVAESRRSRTDHGQISRHPYSSRGSRSDLRDDVSDLYQGEYEQFQNKSRGAVPCKDFIKGNCRWGDSCRFSHNFASDETYGKGARYSSGDKEIEQPSYRTGKQLCKYFAAGKCDRNNCRFSHEDSRFDSLEGREGKRDGPTWIDTDNVKPSVWNGSIDTVIDNSGGNTNERKGTRWSHSLGNENLTRGIPESSDNLIYRNDRPSPPARSGSYSGGLGIGESISMENIANKRDGLNVQGLNSLEVVDQGFSVEAWQNISRFSGTPKQANGVVEKNPVGAFRSDVLDDVKDSQTGTGPISLSGHNLSQNAENVFPEHSKADNVQNMPYHNPSDLVPNLNLQNHQNAMQMTGMLETTVPHFFPNLPTREHSSQFTSSLVPLAGQQVAHVETDYMQFNPISISRDPINLAGDDIGTTNEHGNHTEQNDEMQEGRLSPLSIAGVGPDGSKVDHSGSSKLREEMVLANSDVGEGKRAIGEESKEVQNNQHPETLEGQGKAEESNANKDDKGLRLFKNSLIEFVKDILKPTWKEGRMSRDVHKTIVKKVVDKVTSTIQADHIPKTQEKVEQYLSFSKPKIAKLVQAYVGRCLKTDS